MVPTAWQVIPYLNAWFFARAAAADILAKLDHIELPAELPLWDDSQVTDSDEEVVIQHNWHELRLFMWDYVGIVRTTKRLERALRRVELLQQEIHDYYANFRVSNNLLELRNLAQVAELIIRSAMQRRESRGLALYARLSRHLAAVSSNGFKRRRHQKQNNLSLT